MSVAIGFSRVGAGVRVARSRTGRERRDCLMWIMRTALIATAIAVGTVHAVDPVWADARILVVQDAPPPAVAAPVPPVETPVAPAAQLPSEPQPLAGPQVSGQQAAPPAVSPVPASPQLPPLPPSRFSFARVKEGFLRLDSQTGQTAFCAARAAGWACEAVPEERAALEKEIARLQDEVTGLKREVAALREPPRPPADLAPRPPAPKDGEKHGEKDGDKSGDLTIKLPTQEDIDRATAALQRAWDRVVDMIGNLTKDLTRKAQPDRTTL